jgi:hypothetical protein
MTRVRLSKRRGVRGSRRTRSIGAPIGRTAGLLIAALFLCIPKAKAYGALPDLESILPVVRGIDLAEERLDIFAGPVRKTDPSDEGGIRIIGYALSWLGVPYRLGGFSSSGVDCSGFLNRTIAESYPFLGTIPRRSDEFAGFGEPVEEVEPGDILLFSREGAIYHVGLALSATTFIHSASEGERTGVIISSIWDGTWRSRYSGARRIVAARH